MKKKAFAKKVVAFLLTCLLPTDKWCRQVNKKRLTVVNYHRVTTRPQDLFKRQWGMFVEKSCFEKQMDYLARHHSIVCLRELHAAVTTGAALPDNPVLITFDDGYRDNYIHAFPVLERMGIPAVLFAATGYVDGEHFPWGDRYYMILRHSSLEIMERALNLKNCVPALPKPITNEAMFNTFEAISEAVRDELLTELEEIYGITSRNYKGLICTWQELRDAEKKGISVEAHTRSHPRLPLLSSKQIMEEINFSKVRIETKLNKKVHSMAFPEGRFNKKVLGVFQQNFYALAFSTANGMNSLRTLKKNRYQIKRFCIGLSDTLEVFRLKASGVWKKF